MKKLFYKLKNAVQTTAHSIAQKANAFCIRLYTFNRRALTGNSGEGYLDTAVKVLIAVVLGALLLGGLYALFKDTVMPTVTKRIKDMFDYAG